MPKKEADASASHQERKDDEVTSKGPARRCRRRGDHRRTRRMLGIRRRRAATERLELRVATFPPGADAAAYEAFAAQEAQFEDENPDIDIIGEEYRWTGPTFAVQLAGGSLPDVFTVPFTDTKTLIENGQLIDVTEEIEELGYADSFNPIILDGVTDSDGNIFGFPRQAYAMGLHYNRELFEEAGLDPDAPPTTWDEVREYAKQIHDATGKAGYAQMATANTGGWQLTAQTVARGYRTQTDNEDGSATSTVDNDGTRETLQFLHDLRWEDDSFGAQVRPRLGFDQPGVRGRQHRHVHDRLGHLHRARARLRARPRRLRAHGHADRRTRAGHARRRRRRRHQPDGGRRDQGRGRQVDRLVLHAEAARRGRRRARRQDARRLGPGRRHPGAAGAHAASCTRSR